MSSRAERSAVEGFYSGIISGSGSLTKTGTGKLTLAATNTYSGNTKVSGGTLSIASACLSPTSTVYITASAKLDLNFSGTNTVCFLYLNDNPKAQGIYGASALGGPNYFSGSGRLLVTNTPPALGTIFLVR